jgi:hypothetical protein
VRSVTDTLFWRCLQGVQWASRLVSVTPRAYSAAILSLLAVMAGLLIYTALTRQPVPRVLFAVLILAQAVLRVLRDAAQPSARNRSLLQLLISAVLAYLILTAT